MIVDGKADFNKTDVIDVGGHSAANDQVSGLNGF